MTRGCSRKVSQLNWRLTGRPSPPIAGLNGEQLEGTDVNTGRHACSVDDNAVRTFVRRRIRCSRSGQLYLSESGQLLVSAEALESQRGLACGDWGGIGPSR